MGQSKLTQTEKNADKEITQLFLFIRR